MSHSSDAVAPNSAPSASTRKYIQMFGVTWTRCAS